MGNKKIIILLLMSNNLVNNIHGRPCS